MYLEICGRCPLFNFEFCFENFKFRILVALRLLKLQSGLQHTTQVIARAECIVRGIVPVPEHAARILVGSSGAIMKDCGVKI